METWKSKIYKTKKKLFLFVLMLRTMMMTVIPEIMFEQKNNSSPKSES